MPANVPTQEEFNALAARVTKLEEEGPVVNPEPPEPEQPPDSPLTPSGPITVQSGKTYEGLLIDGQIRGSGDNITIRRCQIRHPVGQHGIDIRGANNLVIEDVFTWVKSPPASGKLSAESNAMYLERTPGVRIKTVRMEDASSGIILVQSPNAQLENIEGINVRGPFPRGQLVQFNKSNACKLRNFSISNDVRKAWTEDNISIFESHDVVVQLGLLDGCNSPTGVSVMVERGERAVIEDVDALHFSNGSFFVYPAQNCTYRRCRAKDSAKDYGRGPASSNGLLVCSTPDSAGTRFESVQWFNHWNPSNILWDSKSCATVQIAQQDFTPRKPLGLVWAKPAPTAEQADTSQFSTTDDGAGGEEHPEFTRGEGPPRGDARGEGSDRTFMSED